MNNIKTGYIRDDLFKAIIDHTPLVSLDFLVRHKGKVLLGKRVNKPAQGYWFTLGGRVLKNENIKHAIKRIGKMELGIITDIDPKFIGIFEHLYEDSIFDAVSTHYINLVYEIEVSIFEDLPKEQHHEYRWFGLDELMQSDDVHDYIKDCFTESKGSIPQ